MRLLKSNNVLLLLDSNRLRIFSLGAISMKKKSLHCMPFFLPHGSLSLVKLAESGDVNVKT